MARWGVDVVAAAAVVGVVVVSAPASFADAVGMVPVPASVPPVTRADPTNAPLAELIVVRPGPDLSNVPAPESNVERLPEGTSSVPAGLISTSAAVPNAAVVSAVRVPALMVVPPV